MSTSFTGWLILFLVYVEGDSFTILQYFNNIDIRTYAGSQWEK